MNELCKQPNMDLVRDPLDTSDECQTVSMISVGDYQFESAEESVGGKTGPLIAMCTDSSRCGGAVYSDASVGIIADKRDFADPYKGVDFIILKHNPSKVIVSSVQRKLITYLEKKFPFNILDISKKGHFVQEMDSPNPAFTLMIVPNVWFCMSNGLKILSDSELVANQGFTDSEEKSLFLASRVDKSQDVCAIRAISAISASISFLVSKEAPAETPLPIPHNSQVISENSANIGPRQNLMPIFMIRYMDMGQIMSIDRSTFESLGIFERQTKRPIRDESDSDPDSQAVPSLFSILNQCQSPQGKRHLHSLMMWPLQDTIEIRNRHDLVDFFLRPDNFLVRDQILVNIKDVVPLASLLNKIQQSTGSYKDFSTLYKTLWSFVSVMDIIKSIETHELQIFNRIIRFDTPELRSLVDSIVNTIDFNLSSKDKKLHICFGVDENVDSKMELAGNLGKICEEVAIQETALYKDILNKQCGVHYVPRIGFLCSVDYTSVSDLVFMKSQKNFDVLLHTEKSIYFKTSKMEELDRSAGDILCDMIDIQENVIMDLQNNLLRHSEDMLRLMELCGELDCLLSFALVSSQRGYKRPEFTLANQEIDIRQMYHPLLSTKFSLIPNDVNFFNQTSQRGVKVMVLTGPNSCGKTTYMKTICLVIYMAHIGCFVPAQAATIPLVDALLTRIHSSNSVTTGLSSFATDIHQLNYAINRATEKSLIAVDEFGKGTQARDGFNLLKGLIMYFATRMDRSPYFVTATHFTRVINHLQNLSEFISYKTFKITRDATKNSITYEYKIMNGVSEDSLADKVAARAGIPLEIIERASQIRNHITEGSPIRPRPPMGA